MQKKGNDSDVYTRMITSLFFLIRELLLTVVKCTYIKVKTLKLQHILHTYSHFFFCSFASCFYKMSVL